MIKKLIYHVADFAYKIKNLRIRVYTSIEKLPKNGSILCDSVSTNDRARDEQRVAGSKNVLLV